MRLKTRADVAALTTLEAAARYLPLGKPDAQYPVFILRIPSIRAQAISRAGAKAASVTPNAAIDAGNGKP